MSCSAVTCNARPSTHKGLSFFRFPNDEKLKKEWVKAMRRMDPINKNKLWTPSKNSRLCSMHFRDEDFDPTSPFKKKMKPGAIPSIFDLPDHLKKLNESKRRVLKRVPLQPQVEQITTESYVINIPAAVPSSILDSPVQVMKSSESEKRVIEKKPVQPRVDQITREPYVINIPAAVPSILCLPAHQNKSSESEKKVTKKITTEPPVIDISDDEPSIIDSPTHPKKSSASEIRVIEKESVQPQVVVPSVINFVIGPKEAFNNLIRNHTNVVQNLEENLKKKNAELDSKEKECLKLRNILAKKEETMARNRNEIKRLLSSNAYIKKQLARLQDTVIELQERNIILEGNFE